MRTFNLNVFLILLLMCSFMWLAVNPAVSMPFFDWMEANWLLGLAGILILSIILVLLNAWMDS